jgi:hypothetical protein
VNNPLCAMRRRQLLIAIALVLTILAAGCGGDGGGREQQEAVQLPRPVAADLARQSDVVAERLEANDPCTALVAAKALQEQTIAAVNDGRVPPRYQEELTGAVNSLLASIECELRVEPPPPTVSETHHEETDEDEDDD